MISYIDLSNSSCKPLPYRKEEEYRFIVSKGWSFSNVYHFSEIRNIFLLLKRFGFNNLKEFTKICLDNNLPSEKTDWNERRILEHINALKNFGLVSENNKIIDLTLFGSSKVIDPISEADLVVFKKIFCHGSSIQIRIKEMNS